MPMSVYIAAAHTPPGEQKVGVHVVAPRHQRDRHPWLVTLRDDPEPLGRAPTTTTGNRARRPTPNSSSESDICDRVHLNPDGQPAIPQPGTSADTKNVPTYYTARQKCAANAVRQLDYAFASRGFHEKVTVRALNDIDEWGPSDHCRLLIEIRTD